MKNTNVLVYQEANKDFQFFLSVLGQKPRISLQIPETLIYDQNKPSSFSYTGANTLIKFSQKIEPNEIASLIIRKVRKRSIYDSALVGKEVASILQSANQVKIITNEKLVNLLLTKRPQSLFPDLKMVQGRVSYSYSITVNYPSDFEIPLKILETLKKIEENLKAKNWSLAQAELVFVYADNGEVFLMNGFNFCMQKKQVRVDTANLTQFRMAPDIRKEFFQSLDYHAATIKSKRLFDLQAVMKGHYEKIKEELSIDQALNTVFQLEVPRKSLPFLAEEKHLKDKDENAFMTQDARNTIRTIRRLSVFQSNEFKMMKSTQRKRGRSIF